MRTCSGRSKWKWSGVESSGNQLENTIPTMRLSASGYMSLQDVRGALCSLTRTIYDPLPRHSHCGVVASPASRIDYSLAEHISTRHGWGWGRGNTIPPGHDC